MWLESAKQEMLLTILKGRICTEKCGMAGIPFPELESVVAKLQHAFTCIPADVGLLTPCNRILKKHPTYIFLRKNKCILMAITDCHIFLRESTMEPMQCKELVCSWPNSVGIVDVSRHDVGGAVMGELGKCTPTVF